MSIYFNIQICEEKKEVNGFEFSLTVKGKLLTLNCGKETSA